MILVTGCPRSGTTFLAEHLRRGGLDIGHERAGGDGAVCWCWAVDRPEYPRGVPRPPPEGFGLRILLVRDPRDCIASMTTLMPETWRWLAAVIRLDLRADVFDRACRVWVQWNRLCAELCETTLRVEDIRSTVPHLNRREHRPPATWEELADRPAVLSMARQFGYLDDCR